MKKILSLLALVLMSCMGAWADGYTISDLANQKQVRFRSYWVNTKYLGVSGNNLVATTTATTEFILVEAETKGTYYLYDAVNDKFVGKTPSNESAAVPCTSNLVDAGVYTFATNSVSDGSHDNSIDRIRINCVNPQRSADPTLHYAGTGDNVICYQNQEWGGNAWQIMNVTTPSDADWQEAYEKVHPTPVGPTAEEISELQEKISNVYKACTTPGVNRVGYPNATNNSTTINALLPYTNNFDNSITASNYNDALAALNAVYALTDVYLPESGKAYRIYNVTKNGTKRVVYYDGTTLKITSNGTTEVPAGKEGVFICGQDAQKFFFTNNSGKYFRVSSTDKVKPASASYGEMVNSNNVNALTISKMSTVNACTDEQRFGLLMIKGYADFSGANGEHYLMGSNAQNFVQGWAGLQMFEDAAQSIGFLFEEVENPNVIKLTKPASNVEGGLNGKYVGTFSAPYAVELPEGVVAYTAEVNEAKTVVTFNEIEGNVVPKNTGVLVYKESATEAVNAPAVPAISTTSIENNAFEAMVNGEIPANSYALSNGTHGVGFYLYNTAKNAKNKAYIPASVAGSNLSAFRFDFEGTLTGIETIENENSNVIYDLQGRRVQNAKSGLYIVNGKKVIR